MPKIVREVNERLHRAMDSHVRLAVTGLSRAGKTAFITSLVNQLLHSSTHDNLPLLEVAQQQRLIGAKRIPQRDLMVPRFSYDDAIASLEDTPPRWPVPTRDVSEIRLAIKFKSQKRHRKLLSSNSTLYLDIIDYPGEWLLDLPLLDQNFDQWSQFQFELLKGRRKELAQPWLDALATLDPKAQANENELAHIAALYTQFLHQAKQEGLHLIQPGRFVLPGELAGAPILQFFPYQLMEANHKPTLSDELLEWLPFGEGSKDKNSNYAVLQERYQQYQQKVVKAFYHHHFATFDRQIVLVDCLQPLNVGFDAFKDMQTALEQIMNSFDYGKSSLLKRLFSPKIDKILFAATKVDHITPEQHSNLTSLLTQMVHPTWQKNAFDSIDMECMSIASIQATAAGFVVAADQNRSAIQGIMLNEQPITLFPGDVPKKLPSREYWQDHHFEFVSFRPMKGEHGQPCPHIRLDKALQFLIGDKLK